MPLTLDEMTPVDKALVDDNHKPTDAEKGALRKAFDRLAAVLGVKPDADAKPVVKAEDGAALAALLEEAKKLMAAMAEHMKQMEGYAAAPAKAGEVAKSQPDPAVKAELEKRDKEIAALTERVEKADTERAVAECIKKAEKLTGLKGTEAESWGRDLHAIEKALGKDSSGYKSFEDRLGRMAAIAQKSEVFKEIGTSAAGEGSTAKGKLESLAKAFQEKNPNTSWGKAYGEVCKTAEGLNLMAEARDETA